MRKKPACSVKFKTSITDSGRRLLESEGINPLRIPSSVISVEVLCLNKICKGIGIKNRHGGMEFFSRDYPINGLVNINYSEVLMFSSSKKVVSHSCCLFADVLDYLSYLTLLGEPEGEKLPRNCDCFVMNDVNNFIAIMLDTVSYDRVHCLFPNTDTGKTMEKTIIGTNQSRATTEARLYHNYESLHEFVKTIRR